ncbi:MAG: metal-dependent transcriptional regulator [Clostridia bacterium]|nr:metal-dependent transcriptional regulator [Clostridia bacterium]
MRTRESEEMYLETILLLKKRLGKVRSVDVVEELGYAKSSVSRAVKLLINNGLILIDRNGDIEFTEKGRARAEDVYDRHRVITGLLLKLGLGAEVAEDNACRIEHVISADLFERLKEIYADTEKEN